jgi:hypothetical protein
MCVGIEYFVNGASVCAFFDSDRPQIPLRRPGGLIAFYTWGARGGIYSNNNTPGWLQKFPEGGHALLEDIRADKWTKYDPKPCRISASRFIQIDLFGLPRYFSLESGEYIQGLIATIAAHQRVYVVMQPAPAEHAQEWPEWPRVVSNSKHS